MKAKDLTLLLPALIALLMSCQPASAPTPSDAPQRILSMAPNITETIYALGLGSNLVGATTFCTYPDAAKNVPRIGGFGQFNYEAIVSANPDLVILHREYDAARTRLKSLGIPYLETGSYFIADILETIRTIGTACGAQPQAQKLISRLNNRIAELTQHRTQRPRVLITFGGSADTNIGQVHAFGTECIHNQMLEIAGGTNVVRGKQPYSILSKEALLRLNPDIIIELAPGMEPEENPAQKWSRLTSISAVRHNRIYQLTGDYTCIPGPRFIQTLEDLTRIIEPNHPAAETATKPEPKQTVQCMTEHPARTHAPHAKRINLRPGSREGPFASTRRSVEQNKPHHPKTGPRIARNQTGIHSPEKKYAAT